VKRPLAPYLPEANPNAPADPVQALRERQRVAIESRTQNAERSRVEGAGVDGAATPPKARTTPNTSADSRRPSTPGSQSGSRPAQSRQAATTATSGSTNAPQGSSASAPAAQPSSEGSNTPSSSKPSETEAETTTTSSEDTPSISPRGPRYDVKAYKKWAEENPEEAAEIGKAVYKMDADMSQEWIRVQNRIRKVKLEAKESNAKALADARAEREAAKADREHAEQVASQIRYVSDMWGAAQNKNARGEPAPDFDSVDEAFRQNTGGITIDDYMRQRARRGIASPELAKERAQRVRLEAELAQLKGGQNNGAAGKAPVEANGAAAAVVPADPAQRTAAPAAPSVNFEEKWGEELPDSHPLRQFATWAKDLEQAMQAYHDDVLDEYSRDPEEIADELVKRKLAALSPAPEPAPKPRAKPANGRPNTPKRRAAASPDGIPSAAELTPRSSVPPRGHRPATQEDLESDAPTDYTKRERWALDRAQRRLRGEAVD
jgi:hypothetical protein